MLQQRFEDSKKAAGGFGLFLTKLSRSPCNNYSRRDVSGFVRVDCWYKCTGWVLSASVSWRRLDGDPCSVTWA